MRKREREKRRREEEEGRKEGEKKKLLRYGCQFRNCMELYGIHVGLGIFQPLSLSIHRLGKP